MGRMSDRTIDNMNAHEMQEYLNNHRSSHDTGYIQFLEEQLEKAEELINHIKKELSKKDINKLIKAYYNDKK